MSIVTDRRLADHDPRSRTWITKLQGHDYSRGEQHLDYVIDNEQRMMGKYGSMLEE